MKRIYMAPTLNYIYSEGGEVEQLMNKGEIKQTESNLQYLIIEEL